jgi:hypothetical protein
MTSAPCSNLRHIGLLELVPEIFGYPNFQVTTQLSISSGFVTRNPAFQKPKKPDPKVWVNPNAQDELGGSLVTEK